MDQDNKTAEQLAAEAAAAAEAEKAANAKPVKSAKARVLVDGSYGKANDVVTLSAAEVKSGVAAGELDSNAAAVAYAESLQEGAKAA